jgi:hypothetical protein
VKIAVERADPQTREVSLRVAPLRRIELDLGHDVIGRDVTAPRLDQHHRDLNH